MDSPLTDTNDHSVISFGISVDRGTKPTARSLYPDFYRANFENINKFLSEINWKIIYNNWKNLQKFYDKFIKTINFSIKQLVPLTKHHRKSKIYPTNIKKLLWEKLKLYKQCKSDKADDTEVSNDYQKAIIMFNIEHENSFFQIINAKKLLLCKI